MDCRTIEGSAIVGVRAWYGRLDIAERQAAAQRDRPRRCYLGARSCRAAVSLAVRRRCS